jgi:hypothetical protein
MKFSGSNEEEPCSEIGHGKQHAKNILRCVPILVDPTQSNPQLGPGSAVERAVKDEAHRESSIGLLVE